MNSQTRPTKVLVVINSLAVGGPQKSLMGLLERIDPTRHDVTLLTLQGNRSGPLHSWVPRHVSVLTPPAIYRAATLPKSEPVRSVALLLSQLSIVNSLRLIMTIALSVARREPRTQLRQRVWVIVQEILPPVPGEYDLALGILGQSTYAVVDLCSAARAYHWVRSDSRILKRNEGIEATYFDRIDGALAVSNSCAEIFEEMYPSARGRVRVYKNDIPAGPEHGDETASARKATYSLLTIGRLDHLKGIDLAIDACAILRNSGIDVAWTVLGEGGQRDDLAKRISRHGLEDRFRLLGDVMNTRPHMEAADVYVHPSRTEGRSNAVEEARALGKPIVAGNYPTVADQVENGVTGLVSDLRAEALADTLAQVIADPELQERLGSAAALAYEKERDDPNQLLDDLVNGRLRT